MKNFDSQKTSAETMQCRALPIACHYLERGIFIRELHRLLRIHIASGLRLTQDILRDMQDIFARATNVLECLAQTGLLLRQPVTA